MAIDPKTIEEMFKDRREFFQALGECINEWAYIERQIYDLFVAALKTDRALAGSIFWSMPSISMRLSYTRALVDLCLRIEPLKPGEHKTQTEIESKSLFSEIVELLKFRNIIAHQPRASTTERPITIQIDKGVVDSGGKTITIIHPNHEDPKQQFDPIKTETMKEHHSSLLVLAARISLFSNVFGKERLK